MDDLLGRIAGARRPIAAGNLRRDRDFTFPAQFQPPPRPPRNPGRNTVQPGAESILPLDRRRLSHEDEKRRLERILGFVLITHEAAA